MFDQTEALKVSFNNFLYFIIFREFKFICIRKNENWFNSRKMKKLLVTLVRDYFWILDEMLKIWKSKMCNEVIQSADTNRSGISEWYNTDVESGKKSKVT